MDCAPVTLWICCHGGYWGMVHWLDIWKSQGKNILNHYWYVVLFKKNVINFNVMIKFSKHSLKISPQFNFSSGFHTEFRRGIFTKLKQCKQTTGPKSVIPRAEMHRTGGTNPSYHVIMSIQPQQQAKIHATVHPECLKHIENYSTNWTQLRKPSHGIWYTH